MSENTIQAYLANNPRMIGILFTICLALMQAGNVLAASANSTNGP
ncbi:DUF7503 family protein [Haladaptatus sp. DFWS20]